MRRLEVREWLEGAAELGFEWRLVSPLKAWDPETSFRHAGGLERERSTSLRNFCSTSSVNHISAHPFTEE